MPEARSHREERVIDAPIEQVWSRMVDFDRYGEWNPFVRGVECDELVPGAAMVLDVRFANGHTTLAREILETAKSPRDDGAELTYRYDGRLRRIGLLAGRRVQRLEPRPDGGCTYVTEESFSGLLRWFIPLGLVARGIRDHADALKQACEAR